MTNDTLPPPLPVSASARQSPAAVRRIGWGLTVLGPCLSFGTSCFAYNLWCMIHLSSMMENHPQWHSSPELTRQVFALAKATFLLGIGLTVGGIYQARTGRRHPVIDGAVLVVAAVAVYYVCRIIAAQP